MSRSKKNWDVLVDSYGNYIDLSGFVKPAKGLKGNTGAKGDKGGAASPFIYKGTVPDYGSLPSGSEDGWVYKTLDDGKFYVSDQFGNYTELTGVSALKGEKGPEGPQGEKGPDGEKGEKGDEGEKGDSGEKGEKGEIGDKGSQGDKGDEGEKGDKGNEGEKGQKGEESEKGQKGELGIDGGKGGKGNKGTKGTKGAQATAFTFQGEVDDFGSLPADANEGDVYKTVDDGKFYASDGKGNWVELPGVTALKGQKGEIGEKGNDGQKGDAITGDKGDKGEVGPKGDNILDTFIDEGQLPKGSTIEDLEDLLKGEKGEKGEEGVKGPQGEKGDKGEVGEKGLKGEIGDKGDKGDKGQKGADLDPDLYYNKGEIDALLTQFPEKGDVYTKGEITNLLIAYPTKGEVTTALGNYYTKAETHTKGYIDTKFDDRYTKGETDELIKGLDEKFVALPYTPLIGNIPPTKGAAPDGVIQIGELFYNVNDLALYVYARNASHDLGWWPTATDYTSDLANVAQRLADLEASLPPIGTISWWMNNNIPTNYLKCDGGTFDVLLYPLLNTHLNGNTLPNLIDYMPVGTGGQLGTGTVGTTFDSRIKSHTHDVQRLEPGNTTGDPDDSPGTSTSRYRYWRGNSSNSGSEGSQQAKTSTATGDSITAPPVILGHWVIRAK